jgi:hypothetical protein
MEESPVLEMRIWRAAERAGDRPIKANISNVKGKIHAACRSATKSERKSPKPAVFEARSKGSHGVSKREHVRFGEPFPNRCEAIFTTFVNRRDPAKNPAPADRAGAGLRIPGL